MFAADETFFDKFLWLHSNTRKTRNNTSSRCIVKTTNLKIKLANQHPMQRRLAKICRALIWSCKICIGDIVKDQCRSFLFSMWKCLACALPWNREVRVRTVNLSFKPKNVAVLSLLVCCFSWNCAKKDTEIQQLTKFLKVNNFFILKLAVEQILWTW